MVSRALSLHHDGVSRALLTLSFLVPLACGGGGSGGSGTEGAEASGSGVGSTTAAMDVSTSAMSDSDATGTGSTTSGTATSASGSASTDASSDTSSSAGESSGEPEPDVPAGVFLWTGSGGGGPPTDLDPDGMLQILLDAGVDAAMGTTLPADFTERMGTLVYLNPLEAFDPAVDAAAAQLVADGGRVVLVMEHCKDGCWGYAPGHNTLLTALGSSMRMHGDGGAPLSDVSLSLMATPPLTDGVSDIVVYYTGRVEVGDSGISLGMMEGGDTIIGLEALGTGEVVAIADSTMFGYRLDAGDNAQFVRNWALH